MYSKAGNDIQALQNKQERLSSHIVALERAQGVAHEVCPEKVRQPEVERQTPNVKETIAERLKRARETVATRNANQVERRRPLRDRKR